MAQITHYSLDWSLGNNSGEVRASDSSGTPHVLNINSAAEFIAVATILSKPSVQIQNGVLSTGKMPVGS